MTAGLALVIALIAGLAFAVSALAAEGPNGPGYVTQTDTTPLGYTSADGYSTTNDGLGVPGGAIKHVWVITMENHAFESNFTGLNDNNYLSQALPKVGALLTNYYGTGHSSLDNYLSEMSGQGPTSDDQDDCASNTSGGISDGFTDMPSWNGTAWNGDNVVNGIDTTSGSADYGQYVSQAGPDAVPGDNGCVYPSSTPTFFNQLDAKGISWRVYAQDLDLTGVYGQNAGVSACGAPQASAGQVNTGQYSTAPDASTSPYYVQGGAAAAGATIGGGNTGTLTVADQYVAKHNPLPWFSSDSSDCNSSHLAPLFGANDQLASDLQSESSTPSFNFIVPNNCSNGHDAVCAGNNLSGGFNGQVANSPINNVGGAYSSDLFLGHIIPEIMNSQAYQDGGLIVINWDEAYPQFTYSSDSFADSTRSAADAFTSITDDSAGETLYGRSLNWEPSGPNEPNIVATDGQQVGAGDGFGEYVNRPYASGGDAASGNQIACNTSPTGTNGYITLPSGSCYSGGSNYPSNTPTVAAGSVSASGVVTQNPTSTSKTNTLVTPNEEGEQVTLPSGVTTSATGNVYVGQVLSSSAPAAITSTSTDTTADDTVPSVRFQLVDASGNPVTITSGAFTLSSSNDITLGGETPATDPLYDAFDGTDGGGDTGAILISPYIKGGTVSNTYYNHYSLLRSLEDIFDVASGGGTGAQSGYTGPINVSTGLDGAGHLGFAAQAGLAPFGSDVFTNAPSAGSQTVTATVTTTKTVYNDVPGGVTVPGTPIRVYVGVVPKLKNLSLGQARAALGYAGLRVGKVTQPKLKKGDELVVSGQSIPAGRTERRDTKVNLTLVLVREK